MVLNYLIIDSTLEGRYDAGVKGILKDQLSKLTLLPDDDDYYLNTRLKYEVKTAKQ